MTPTETPSSPARPGRPREASVDQRLQASVLKLLRDRGPGAVTMDRVTSTSGVAKTSIYRRYPNRGALLTAVLAQAIGAPDVPREGTVRDKIRFALEQAWHQMGTVLGPGGLAALVGNTDPEFTELFRAALQPYVDTLVSRIRDDVDAGALRPGLDAEGIVSLMVGAYLGELVRRGTVAPEWMDRTLELLWLLMAPPPQAE
ncbi:TetR family transcriptional regulator [Nocardioides sp. S5]|uniref:TetR/AcrR family transcriptional regulator n=1 Tax=Nocardioides sp. S5 TaxID=2017486 RepID=UPI001AFAF074|nr:TetR/AcrR family transcriptional regulator [Nocardioides sp. S5]QSR32909.1 TetR family transcriptional regulator [Nocardioides sp. S5]